MPTINGTNISPIGSGEGLFEFDVTIATTTGTNTTVTATLTFGRPFASAPNLVNAYISSSTEARIAVVGVDTITATSCVVWIRQGGTALTAEDKTVKVVFSGQLL